MKLAAQIVKDAFHLHHDLPLAGCKLEVAWSVKPRSAMELAEALENFLGAGQPRLPVQLLWEKRGIHWPKMDRNRGMYVSCAGSQYYLNFNVSVPPPAKHLKATKITINYLTRSSQVTTLATERDYNLYLENLVNTLGTPIQMAEGLSRGYLAGRESSMTA